MIKLNFKTNYKKKKKIIDCHKSTAGQVPNGNIFLNYGTIFHFGWYKRADSNQLGQSKVVDPRWTAQSVVTGIIAAIMKLNQCATKLLSSLRIDPRILGLHSNPFPARATAVVANSDS